MTSESKGAEFDLAMFTYVRRFFKCILNKFSFFMLFIVISFTGPAEISHEIFELFHNFVILLEKFR
jgi:hypothetical protein